MSFHACKTVTYSLMHLSVAMTVAFVLTGSWQAALAIGLIEPLVQTAAYMLHERAWARVDFPNVSKRSCAVPGEAC